MRVTINRMALVQALNRLEAAIPLKSQYLKDIYYHVLVQADRTGITLTATNDDMRVALRVVASLLVIEEGACAVNYAKLVEALKAFPRKADLLIRQEGEGIVVSCGSLSKAVEGLPANEYPQSTAIPGVGETFDTEEYDRYTGYGKTGMERSISKFTFQVLQVHTQRLTMQQDTLLAMAEKVAFAAEKEGSRPVLMGIYTQLKDDELTLVAADGFRMAVHRGRVVGAGSWEHGALISAKYFVRGLKLMSQDWESQQISVEAYAITKQQVRRNGYEVTDKEPTLEFVLVRLVGDHEVVELRPIVGSYPNYEHFIPRQITTLATCETAVLLAALEELMQVAKKAHNRTFWYVEEESLRIEVQPDTQAVTEPVEQPESVVKQVPTARTGDEVRIALNGAYVLDILRAIPTQQVVLGLLSSEKPAVFQAWGETKTSYTLMPMSPNR